MSQWPHFGLGILLLGTLVGCAMLGGGSPPSDRVQFIDYEGFDSQLRDALSHGYPTVTVTFAPNSATVNQLPGRIERWLSGIDGAAGGRVEAQPDPTIPHERGFLLAAIPLVLAAYQFADSWILYRPVGDYDALVYYVPGTGSLTRVIFVRRQPSG